MVSLFFKPDRFFTPFLYRAFQIPGLPPEITMDAWNVVSASTQIVLFVYGSVINMSEAKSELGWNLHL